MVRMTLRWLRLLGTAVAAIVAVIGCNAVLGNDVGHLKTSAKACTLNSDCNAGDLCIFATCSIPCRTDVDCADGSRCLETSKGAACVASSAAACANDESCPEGAVCSDQVCRAPCQTVGGTVCHGDQTCTAHVCLGADSAHDPASGDATDAGASGGSTSNGGARATGGALGGGGIRGSGGAAAGGTSGAGGATGDGGFGGATGGTTGSGGTTGPGGAAATGGAGGTGGSSGVTVKVLKTTNVNIQPGQEVFECQTFSNPFGADMAVVETDSTMPDIAHQTVAYYDSSYTDGAIATCSGFESHAFIHDTQIPADTMRYPADVGRLLKATDGLRIQTHYINVGVSTVSAQATLTLRAVPLASVHTLADGMFLFNTTINIPPLTSSVTLSKAYTLPYEVNFLRAVGLMYRHGTHMKATVPGGYLYDQTSWTAPTATLFSTPLKVPSGQILTWACTYANNQNTVITFGSSVSNNERCEFYGVFYATLPEKQGQFLTGSGDP